MKLENGRYKVILPYADDLRRRDQLRWCQDNLGRQHHDVVLPSWIPPWRPNPGSHWELYWERGQDTDAWLFRQLEDAMAFQLAWGFEGDNTLNE
jgi:hypothetical protein